MKKVCLVSAVHKQPTNKWIKSLPDIPVFIVDDSDGQINFTRDNIEVFDYKRQKKELGKNYDYFAKTFHKSPACKNFGLWYAYKQKFDFVIVIDSDCIIEDKAFVNKHLLNIQELKGWRWENPLVGTGYFSRGFPYEERNTRVVLNLGLWNGLWDINGKDRDEKNSARNYPAQIGWFPQTMVALGIIPLSGMNFIIRRDAIPALLFLPNFGEFKRHDDIMGGYIFQRIMQKAGECLTYGQPLVYHNSDVDAKKDEEEEKAMNTSGMYFYRLVDKAIQEIMPCDNYASMFRQFESSIHDSLIGTMFESLILTFKWWSDLFQKNV